MKVTLLGLDFALENMGCQALAYSFVSIFNNAVKKQGICCSYVAVVNREFDHLELDGEKIDVECLKLQYRNRDFWKKLKEAFSTSSLIIDFTGGDSFSDIYGVKRFLMASVIKKLAIGSKRPFVLGPQTYGPYKRLWCRLLAQNIIKGCRWVFARDSMSLELATKLSKRNVVLTTDVAFSLPFVPAQVESNGKVKIGINVSGLLWNNGYSFANIPLAVDYRTYCNNLLEVLTKSDKYQVYLISHVKKSIGVTREDDYSVCKEMHEKFPNTVLFNSFETPMEAKNVISAMDVFIGARMHATIAAFSAGVATIPFSYSRKFEGLYNSLDYPFVISAQTESTENALDNTMKWIKDYKNLAEMVEKSRIVVREKQEKFEKELHDIIEVVNPEK